MFKKSLSLLTALLILGSLYAQDLKYMSALEKGSLYIDNNEVSIQSWNEYAWWTLHHYGATSDRYLATLPDTALFRKVYSRSYIIPGSLTTAYTIEDALFQKEYAQHPIVGLSYEQCRDFCSWRTMMWNALPSHKTHLIFAMPSDADLRQAATLKKVNGLNDGDQEHNSFRLKATTGQFRCLCIVPQTYAQEVYARLTAYDDWNVSLLMNYSIGDTLQPIDAIMLSPTDDASWDSITSLFFHSNSHARKSTKISKSLQNARIHFANPQDSTLQTIAPNNQTEHCLVIEYPEKQIVGLFFLKDLDIFQPTLKHLLLRLKESGAE